MLRGIVMLFSSSASFCGNETAANQEATFLHIVHPSIQISSYYTVPNLPVPILITTGRWSNLVIWKIPVAVFASGEG